MVDITTLAVEIDATGAKRGAQDIGRSVKRIQRSIGGVGGVFKSTTVAIAGFGRSLFGLQGAIAGIGFGFLVSELIQAADAFTLLQGRLDLVTDSAEEAATANQLLFQVAQSTSTRFSTVVDLYTKLSRATEDLGTSQDELINVTNAISQALVVSGVDANSAQAALVQLGQGLQAGALRGDEFNSVVEQTPRLAKLLADGLGVTIGQLRELAQAGELTASRVVQGLGRGAERLEDEFGKIPDTVGKALQRVSNDIQTGIAQIDTAPLAGAIEEIRTAAADSRIAEDLGEAFNGVLQIVANVTRSIIDNWGKVQAATISLIGASISAWKTLEQSVLTVITVIQFAWQKSIDFIAGLYADFVSGLASVLDVLPGTSDIVGDLRNVSQSTNDAISATGSLTEELAKLDAQYAKTQAQIKQNTSNAIQNVLRTKDQVKATSELTQALARARTQEGGPTAASECDKACQRERSAAMKKAATETANAKKQVDQLIQSLAMQNATFGQGRSAIVEYDARHGRLSETLRKAGVDVELYTDQIVELARNLEAQDIERAFGDPQKVLDQRRKDLDRLVLSEEAHTNALRDAEDAYFMAREALSQLSAEQQANNTLLSAQLDLRRAEDAAQVSRGLIGRADQYKANNELIRENIRLLEEQLAQLTALPQTVGRDTQIAQVQANIVTLGASIRDLNDDLRDTFETSLGNSVKSVIDGTATMKDAFFSLFDSVLNELQNNFSKQIAKSLTNSLLPNFGASRGGGTSSFGILGDLFGGIFGQRQFGGAAISNRPYIVGEQGPEVFVPGTSGQVIPDANVGGVVVNMTINTPDANSFRASQDHIARDMSSRVAHSQRFQG